MKRGELSGSLPDHVQGLTLSLSKGNQQPSFVRRHIEGSETIPQGSTLLRH